MANDYNGKPAWETNFFDKDYIYWNSNTQQMMLSIRLGEQNHIRAYHDGELTYSNMMDWKYKTGGIMDHLKCVAYM